VIALTVGLASILSLLHTDSSIRNTRRLDIVLRNLAMSLNLGDGKCEWRAALSTEDNGFPTTQTFLKTIIAGYPSGDKRVVFSQLEGLTGLSTRDEWEFAFLGMTNQPFIKANYPHHEGIWGWGDVADQVVMVVSPLKRVLIEYHDILWDIGYAQTFEEAYERITNLYISAGAGVPEENAPVEEFLVWRDLRVFDEIHWYSWFIDYYMEAGLMRDMFNHEVTVEAQWQMSILPNFFTKHEVRHGRFVNDTDALTNTYDPMCATLSKGCYPVMVLDPEKLVHPDYGPIEARKLAQVVNGTEGFDEWMIEEEAWECIWRELIIEKKGITTFLDKATLDYDSYTYSFEMKNEMWHQTNRLIEKYEVRGDQVAIDLVNILRGHREELGVDTPTDPISYEQLMGYHLAYPPFFPNQKPFISDDDFYVNQQQEYSEPFMGSFESIIDRRRIMFGAEIEAKEDMIIDINYYDAANWTSIPAAGLSSLTPYATDTTTEIKFRRSEGEFATSGKSDYVAALFQGYVHATSRVSEICVTSSDGSKLYLDDVLKIDNDGVHNREQKCASISEGVYKVDIEYFESTGGALILAEWGMGNERYRNIAARYWASADLQRRHLEMTRLNDILEEDLRNLKDTDIMGPMTRMEYNFRKAGGSVSEPKFIDVLCQGHPETDFCDCDSDCKYSAEFCTCPEALACCESNESDGRKLNMRSKYDFSRFDEILKEKRLRQMKNARSS